MPGTPFLGMRCPPSGAALTRRRGSTVTQARGDFSRRPFRSTTDTPRGSFHLWVKWQTYAMNLQTRFATNVLILRKKRNLSQKDLADRMGVSNSYVSMLERGQRSPPLETIELIAKALGVRAEALLSRM